MKDPLGVSPSKGNQGTKRGKEKNSFDLGGNRTHDLRIRSTVTLKANYALFNMHFAAKLLHLASRESVSGRSTGSEALYGSVDKLIAYLKA